MGQEGKTRYTESELSEFEALILDKVAKAKNELSELKRSLQKGGDSGEDITNNSTKVLEPSRKSSSTLI